MASLFNARDTILIRDAFVDARKRLLDFTGVSDQVQYLAVGGSVLGLHTACLILLRDPGTAGALVRVLVTGWCLLAACALTIRRLRDAGWPLVLASLVFVPGIAFLMVPILGGAPSVRR